MKCALRNCAVLLPLIFFSGNCLARPDYLQAWQNLYPNAKAGELACQLCHQSPDGGDGWNGYGFDIRTTFFDVFGGSRMDETILFIESLNSDQDEKNLSNIHEIDAGLFPGWVNSATNVIYFKDSTFLLNQPPPAPEGTEPTEPETLCFPIKNQIRATVLVCL